MSIVHKPGNVYEFSFSQEWLNRERSMIGDPHWCFDKQLVLGKDMVLRDTYWMHHNVTPGDGNDQYASFVLHFPYDVTKRFTLEEALERGSLKLICHLEDVREIREYETRHYEMTEWHNLTYHSGHRKWFVVNKTAERSVSKMMREVQDKLNITEREIASAVKRALFEVARLEVLKHRLEQGDTTMDLWW